MITLYARYVPYVQEFENIPGKRWRNVEVARDLDFKDVVGTYNPGNKRRPTRRSKTVVLNCFRCRLVWCEEVKRDGK
jgi:hypothetical protein